MMIEKISMEAGLFSNESESDMIIIYFAEEIKGVDLLFS